ncbi:MAG TPA: CHAT domain-containing protein, partial [Pseudonocardiaceae bacterium]|nr:CHAT domain-containing protein [Pseudonocardiaceae bacterium]
MAADWTRAEFDAAVDKLCASAVPDLELTPAQWRHIRGMSGDTDVEAFRAHVTRFNHFLIMPVSQQLLTQNLHELGTAVLGQWERTGDRRAMRMAIVLWREVASSSYLEDLGPPIGALAVRLLDRYHATAGLPLLDGAVYLGRDAIFNAVASPSSRPGRVLVLAEALLCRYEHTGDRSALVEAVARYREAADAAGTRQSALDGLGMAKAHMSELTGDLAVLDDFFSSEVVAPSRQPPPGRPLVTAASLAVAAAAHLADYLRPGDSSRLHDATEALNAALRLTPADHRDRPLRLARLGSVLYHTYRRWLEVSALEDSVTAYRDALALPIDRPAVRTEMLVGLAQALRARYDTAGGRPEHLAEMRLLIGELSAQYPPGHPNRADVLAEVTDPPAERMLPVVAKDDWRQAEQLVDLAASPSTSDADALVAYAKAAQLPDAPIPVRGLASQQWARLAAERGDLDAAEKAYRLTIDLLPALVSDLKQRGDQEYQLLPFAGLASNAAACALRRGADPAEAVDLLERGRCVLFAHTLGERPVLVDQMVCSRVAADGPVVVVNVSRFGSHALALTAGGIRVIPLPALTPTAVEDHRVALDVAYDLLRCPGAEADLRWAAGRYVTGLLTWLWDAAAGPVLDALGLAAGADPLPRLWWLPTGPLSLLPLHAAGYHAAGDGRTVLDRVVSSYTPTLHQLLRARSRAARRPAERSLVVAVGDLPGLQLPAAAAEAAVVGQYVPNARVLLDAEADPDAVRRGLVHAAWVHIACHAVTDVANPSASRLVLAGGDLTVSDIGRLHLPDAHLA